MDTCAYIVMVYTHMHNLNCPLHLVQISALATSFVKCI